MKLDNLSAADSISLQNFSADYIDFLSTSKTERETLEFAINTALNHKFSSIVDEKTRIKPGAKVYLDFMGKCGIFFIVGEEGIGILREEGRGRREEGILLIISLTFNLSNYPTIQLSNYPTIQLKKEEKEMVINAYKYGWEEVQALPEGGGGQKLSAGGYVCLIVEAHAEVVKGQGVKMIFDVDIAEGEYTRFYSKRLAYVADWDFNARLTRYIMKGEQKITPTFKWLIKLLEAENPNWHCNLENIADEKQYAGLMCGFVFGEKEYLGRDDKIRTSVNVKYPCKIEDVREGKITPPPIEKLPEDKRPKKDYSAEFTGENVSEEETPFF